MADGFLYAIMHRDSHHGMTVRPVEYEGLLAVEHTDAT